MPLPGAIVQEKKMSRRNPFYRTGCMYGMVHVRIQRGEGEGGQEVWTPPGKLQKYSLP